MRVVLLLSCRHSAIFGFVLKFLPDKMRTGLLLRWLIIIFVGRLTF